jgi:hypothetical protein
LKIFPNQARRPKCAAPGLKKTALFWITFLHPVKPRNSAVLLLFKYWAIMVSYGAICNFASFVINTKDRQRETSFEISSQGKYFLCYFQTQLYPHVYPSGLTGLSLLTW